MFELVVVQGNRPALFGRDWMKYIKTDWKNFMTCNMVSEDFDNNIKVPVSEAYPPQYNELLRQNEVPFSTVNTGIKNFTASVHLKPNVKPVFQKHRCVR